MAHSVLRSRTYGHPIDRVWHALTTPDVLAAWLMPNDLAPRVGHRFTFRTDPSPGFDGVVHSEVLALEAPRRLVLAWRGGGIDTTMTFELSEVRGGTHLSLHHEGFEGFRGRAVGAVLGSGWRGLLASALPAALDALAEGRAPQAAPKRGGAWAAIATLLAPLSRRGEEDR